MTAAAADGHIAGWLCAEVNSRQAAAGWSLPVRSSSSGGATTEGAARVALATTGGAGVATPCGGLPDAPGSFLLHGQANGSHTVTVQVQAADSSGLRAGAARLMRELHMPARWGPTSEVGERADSEVSLPTGLCVRYDASTALWHT